MTTCSTCAQQLPADNLSEAKQRPARQTPCCDRTICAKCQSQNPRFQAYCPFCQISSAPTSLPQGLRDPPGYEEAEAQEVERRRLEEMRKQRSADVGTGHAEAPPEYTATSQTHMAHGQTQTANGLPEGEDVTHHVRPEDTVTSISLAYHIPLQILRSHNNLYSDHLVSARHTISIPASHYQGPSLSAEPVESEEERERKARLRRFMMRTKCTDYSVAELYLRDAKEIVDNAVQRWEDDERWERENPMKGGSAGSSKRGLAGGLTGQIG